MNYALRLNMVHGYDSRLSHNFNHLLFADDLVIITRTFRKVAKYCRFCLEI